MVNELSSRTYRRLPLIVFGLLYIEGIHSSTVHTFITRYAGDGAEWADGGEDCGQVRNSLAGPGLYYHPIAPV